MVLVRRRGSVTIIRWVADGKYSSKARRLIVIFPSPSPSDGRRRTRAMASLRRPVVWVSGLGTKRTPGLRGAPGAVDGERLRRLSSVGMGGTGVHLELAQLGPAEGALGQHAPHGPAHCFLGLGVEQLAVRLLADTARIPGVPVEDRLLRLVRGHDDLGGVDDHDEVARIHV